MKTHAGTTMTKKRAWQTLSWMSAVFLLNHIFFQGSQISFVTDQTRSLLYSGLYLSMTESFPALGMEQEDLEPGRWFRQWCDHLKEESFPMVDYCGKYWKDTADFVGAEEEIPALFYETEEGSEEKTNETEEQTEMKQSVIYTKEQLKDYSFLVKNIYTIDSTTTATAGELKGDILSEKDLSIEFSETEPKILIYHTHGSESFSDSNGADKEETIIGVGDTLAELLEQTYHIKTYHDRSLYDMINGKLDRSKAYTYAGNNVTKILEKYPSIEVVIDLHRDAVREGTRLVTDIDGKRTAKIMFFNGLSRTAKNGDISYLKNPNKEDNLAFSLQMQLAAASKYPGFTRKIYLKGYRYNLHLKPRSLLIEAGAQTNTKEEVKNAMIPLADLLYTVLKK